VGVQEVIENIESQFSGPELPSHSSHSSHGSINDIDNSIADCRDSEGSQKRSESSEDIQSPNHMQIQLKHSPHAEIFIDDNDDDNRMDEITNQKP
jgi:hypothetical protein